MSEWPEAPMPHHAEAILLLPSGIRALDESVTVAFPPPQTLERVLLGRTGAQTVGYRLFHIQHPGEVDRVTRALYVLGGTYMPHGVPTAEDELGATELRDDE